MEHKAYSSSIRSIAFSLSTVNAVQKWKYFNADHSYAGVCVWLFSDRSAKLWICGFYKITVATLLDYFVVL